MVNEMLQQEGAAFSWAALGRMLLARWSTLAWTAALFLLLGFVYLQLAKPSYKAMITLVPTSTGSPASSSLLKSVAGLASVVNANFSALGDTNIEEYMALLQSRRVAERLAGSAYIMRMAFPNDWNSARKQFVPPSGLSGVLDGVYRAIFSIPPWHAPGGEELQTYLIKRLNVATSPSTSIITVAFTHPDSGFSAKFLSLVHAQADALMREDAKLRSEQRIVYLEKLLLKTIPTDQRMALIGMLSTEQQSAMLATVDKYYSAAVLDAPEPDYWPNWPQGVLFIIALLIASLFFGCLLVATGLDRRIGAIISRKNGGSWVRSARGGSQV